MKIFTLRNNKRVSRILSTGGVHPPGRHPPPRDGHCSGRYTSYWNAFLVCSYYNQNDHCFALDTCNFELSILPAKSGEFTCEVMIWIEKYVQWTLAQWTMIKFLIILMDLNLFILVITFRHPLKFSFFLIKYK